MPQAQQPGNRRRPPRATRHRRESFWQITLPILVMLLVLGLAFALVVLSGARGISGVASLSLILVSLPLLLIGLSVLAVIVALLLGAGWLLRETPSYTRIVQDVSARISDIVQRAMQQVTKVLVSIMTGFSMARRFLSGDGTKGGDGTKPDNPSLQ